MNATFDFKRRVDTEDCHTMFTAFGYSHTMQDNRITVPYEANTFGAIAGEAAVFAPVQITVDD